MKILITGGCGFVGSHLCDKYVEDGHTVICLDNFMSGNLLNVRHLLDCRNFKLVKGDIRDKELLSKLTQGVEVVFHLAAQIHVDRSYIEPELTYDINVMGTQNVLDAAGFNDVSKVIFASSSEVYGSAQYVPMDEKHPLAAPHPYGASKISADRMCYAYAKTYCMDIRILRCFNIYGPRQRELGYGGVISIFTSRLLRGLPPVIYGDGKQTRDYTYIDDIVRAYDLMMNHSEPISEPINFGTGKEISIGELHQRINRCFNDCVIAEGPYTPIYESARIGEVCRLIADSYRAKDLLGWQTEMTFTKGLIKFIGWYKKYGFDREVLKIG